MILKEFKELPKEMQNDSVLKYYDVLKQKK